MAAMSKGGLFLALVLMLAACAPHQSRVPRGAEDWPVNKRVQRLPPAQPLPPPKPQWVAREVTPDAVEVPAQTYVVRPGDTLRRISDRLGASSEAIARANNIPPPFIIRVGERLSIPGGRYHRVKSGETGIAIARAYGVSWSKVVDGNALEEPYVLRVGQKLLLPSARQVAAMSLEDRARAFTIDIGDLITGGEPAAEESAATAPRPATPDQGPVVAPSSFAGRFDWPARGTILSRYGAKPGGRFNDGINIRAAAGSPVRAAADGVIAYAGDTLPGFGNLILIKHGGNWVTAYAHADALLVGRGQIVKRGDVIARAGQTGSVDEPQVHFEIREGRKPLDPLTLLPKSG